MDKPQNKYLSVAYKLYTVADGKKELEEMTHEDHPFQFISGFGMALDGFERNVVGLKNGDKFDFSLSHEEAFGEYDPEGVHQLSREVFSINGHFDHENIFEGAVITLMDEDDHRFMARVLKVDEGGVTVDTNHPLAGKDLNFVGEVVESRDATNQEIEHMINHLSSGCGCHCDDCEGKHGGSEHCGSSDGQHSHHGDHDHCGCGHCHH